MTKVMCFGTFDNLHPGHLFYLKEARKLGDYLVVLVARDDNVEKIKGRCPKESEEKRLLKVQKTGIAERVVLGEKIDKMLIVKKENPDIIALGYDQQVDIDNLKKIVKAKIVRIEPPKPEIYKSSKIK